MTVITCGAAGGRLDPTRIRHGDLARLPATPAGQGATATCDAIMDFRATAARGRRRFGVIGDLLGRARARPASECGAEAGDLGAALACAGYGSSVAVTATMGFVAAAHALDAAIWSVR